MGMGKVKNFKNFSCTRRHRIEAINDTVRYCTMRLRLQKHHAVKKNSGIYAIKLKKLVILSDCISSNFWEPICFFISSTFYTESNGVVQN